MNYINLEVVKQIDLTFQFKMAYYKQARPMKGHEKDHISGSTLVGITLPLKEIISMIAIMKHV